MLLNLLLTPAPGGSGSFLGGMLPILLIFAIFYFLLFMPMQRQKKKQKKMLQDLKSGDTVMTNGGIIGTLLDCHSNWAATWHLMRRDGADTPPCTVTAEYHIRMKRPTPSDRPIRLTARVVESEGDRATVEGEIRSGDRVTATCTGVFVAVKPGHPAYHRW